MTRRSQLDKFLGVHDTITSSYFRGVYSIDDLRDGGLIDSIDMNSKNVFVFFAGKHFFGIYIDQTKAVFADPAEKSAAFYSEWVVSFLTYYYPNYLEIPYRVQSPPSVLCAAYSVYFLHKLCLGSTTDQLCALFSSSLLKQNDKLLRSWYKTNYPSYMHLLFD